MMPAPPKLVVGMMNGSFTLRSVNIKAVQGRSDQHLLAWMRIPFFLLLLRGGVIIRRKDDEHQGDNKRPHVALRRPGRVKR